MKKEFKLAKVLERYYTIYMKKVQAKYIISEKAKKAIAKKAKQLGCSASYLVETLTGYLRQI